MEKENNIVTQIKRYKEDLEISSKVQPGEFHNSSIGSSYKLSQSEKELLLARLEDEGDNFDIPVDDISTLSHQLDKIWVFCNFLSGDTALTLITSRGSALDIPIALVAKSVADPETVSKLKIDTKDESLEITPIDFVCQTGAILKEDLEFGDSSRFASMNIYDVYDELGEETFNDENIEELKRSGIIGESGYPIGENNEELTLNDISNLNYKFLKTNYFKELALKEYIAEAGENPITIKIDSSDLTGTRDFSDSFIEGCFAGDPWEAFYGYDYSFDDIYDLDVEDNIPKEVKGLLVKVGFPEDIIEQLIARKQDDDSPLEKYYDDIRDAVARAYSGASEDGTITSCLYDFNYAFKESIPEGCEWLEKESDDEFRPISISLDCVKNNLDEILDNGFEYYSTNIKDCVEEWVRSEISSNFAVNFREPYAGWYGFDVDSFKDRLFDNISDIDFE